MRKDFPQLLTERERRKPYDYGSKSAPTRDERDLEYAHARANARKMEGMRPRGNGRGRKDLNENLRPLYNYLRKQIGRPWNKVFSEISQVSPNKNQVLAHVYTHVWQIVERDVVVIDKKPYYKANSSYGRRQRGLPAPLLPIHEHGRLQLYVCPKSGLLKRAPKWKKKKTYRKGNPYEIKLSVLEILRRRDGIWYRDRKHWVLYPADPEKPRSVDRWQVEHLSTQQLSTRELRQRGLVNKPGEPEFEEDPLYPWKRG
jgi:hypothetical protein